MQIEKIKYEKLFSLGNYENEKIGVEIALGEGDDPVKCHLEAVKYVEHAHRFQKDYPQYERAKQIEKDPMTYTGRQVEQAKQVVATFETNYAQFLSVSGQPLLEPSRKAEEPDDISGCYETPQYASSDDDDEAQYIR